jgi:hypothetical protein
VKLLSAISTTCRRRVRTVTFRDLAMEQGYKLPVARRGAQFGGKYFCHDGA